LNDAELRLLQDPVDGLVIEIRDGKEVIKAGRLARLVDRLADHLNSGTFIIAFGAYFAHFRFGLPQYILVDASLVYHVTRTTRSAHEALRPVSALWSRPENVRALCSPKSHSRSHAV
jgi:hypothetical protein